MIPRCRRPDWYVLGNAIAIAAAALGVAIEEYIGGLRARVRLPLPWGVSAHHRVG
jgi:hypothetical protein